MFPPFYLLTGWFIRAVWWCLAFGLASGLVTVAAAAPEVVLTGKNESVDLVRLAEYRIDASGKLSVDEIAVVDGTPAPGAASAPTTWLSNPERGIYPLLPGQALWLRFGVLHSADSTHWLLEIPYAALSQASLFTRSANGAYNVQRAGDLLPNRAWTLPQRHVVMEIEAAAGTGTGAGTFTPTQYLLRLENAQGFSAPIRLISAHKLLRAEQGTSLLLGAYFGVSLLGAIIALIGLVWLRDWAYLFYAVCALLIGLTQAASTGLGSLYLWPNSPGWADRSLAVSGMLALISLALLNAKIVYLAQRSKRLDSLVWGLALLGLVLCAAMFATDSSWRIALSTTFLAVLVCVVLAINLWAWRHGDRFGLWLLISAVPFFVALGVAVARYLGWIPLSFFTEQSWLASLALQQITMLASLFLRSQQRREIQRRLTGADRVDPTTGLLNEQVFSTRLARMVARSERLKHQSAVMIIQVTNTAQIERDFGRKMADRLPLLVASRLSSTARDIDSAARLSDLRFGMLVEGPFSAEEAATLGLRIVARCLMPYRGLHMDCVAQVRIAYALVPETSGSAEPLLARLETLLTLAPTSQKKAVFRLGEAAPLPRRHMVPRRESN